MDNNILVEILLATYNGESYLSGQIESILEQSYSNWVLKIRDDGSSDGTVKIIKKYQKEHPEKIILLERTESKSGAKYNFWELIKQSDGDCIMCCDQDDIWNRNKIERTLNKFLEMETCTPVLVYTDLRVVDENLEVISNSFQEYSGINGKRNALNNILCENVVTGCTMMFNSKLRDTALKVKEIEDMKMHDHWLALVASSFGEIEYIESATIEYRQHGDNAVGARSISRIKKIKYILNEIDNLSKTIEGYVKQAELFYNSYSMELQTKDSEMLQSFISLGEKNKIYRIATMVKYSIYKNNFIKRLALLIAV